VSKFADMANGLTGVYDQDDPLALAKAVGVMGVEEDTYDINDLMRDFDKSPDETVAFIRRLASDDAHSLTRQLQQKRTDFDQLHTRVVMSELLRHHVRYTEASSDDSVSVESLEGSLEKATYAALNGRKLSKLYFQSRKREAVTTDKSNVEKPADAEPIVVETIDRTSPDPVLVPEDEITESDFDAHLRMFIETTRACQEML